MGACAPALLCACVCARAWHTPIAAQPAGYNMHLMYYLDASGKRVYTLKKTAPDGSPTHSAHPGACCARATALRVTVTARCCAAASQRAFRRMTSSLGTASPPRRSSGCCRRRSRLRTSEGDTTPTIAATHTRTGPRRGCIARPRGSRFSAVPSSRDPAYSICLAPHSSQPTKPLRDAVDCKAVGLVRRLAAVLLS